MKIRNFYNLKVAINIAVSNTELWWILNFKDSKTENNNNFIPETSVCAISWCFRFQLEKMQS